MCLFRIKGAPRLPACLLLLPALITRTSSATSPCIPSSRPAVCFPLFPSAASRWCTPRPPRRRRPAWRAARVSGAAAPRAPSTGRRAIMRSNQTSVSATVGKRRMSRPAWKPSPHSRSPRRTRTERSLFFVLVNIILMPSPATATTLMSWPHLYPIRGNIITLPLVLHIAQAASSPKCAEMKPLCREERKKTLWSCLMCPFLGRPVIQSDESQDVSQIVESFWVPVQYGKILKLIIFDNICLT